jgi:hypothetical protein
MIADCAAFEANAELMMLNAEDKVIARSRKHGGLG